MRPILNKTWPVSRTASITFEGPILVLFGLIILAALHGADTRWLHWSVSVDYHPAFLEAWCWWFGQTNLPYRLWDTAVDPATGQFYNVFPPLQTLIGFILCAPHRIEPVSPQWPQFHLAPLLLFGLTLPVVGYWAFARRTASPRWGAILALGWIGGTAVAPCIDQARIDGIHHINHLLSQIGLLIFASELLGRRRWNLAVVGLIIAAWSRQLTILYGLALLIEAWRRPHAAADPPPQQTEPRGKNRAPLRVVLTGLIIAILVPMALNYIRFGNPLNSGYGYIYADRDTDLADAYRAGGLFSPSFTPRNARHMNVAFDPPVAPVDGERRWQPDGNGASIWLTTPLLALALAGARYWWRQPAGRSLMLCSIPIIAALLAYHGTGYRQPGYYRFALDFAPVWLLVAAPWLTTGWRRWATLACIIWSVGYFALLDRWAVIPT